MKQSGEFRRAQRGEFYLAEGVANIALNDSIVRPERHILIPGGSAE